MSYHYPPILELLSPLQISLSKEQFQPLTFRKLAQQRSSLPLSSACPFTQFLHSERRYEQQSPQISSTVSSTNSIANANSISKTSSSSFASSSKSLLSKQDPPQIQKQFKVNPFDLSYESHFENNSFKRCSPYCPKEKVQVDNKQHKKRDYEPRVNILNHVSLLPNHPAKNQEDRKGTPIRFMARTKTNQENMDPTIYALKPRSQLQAEKHLMSQNDAFKPRSQLQAEKHLMSQNDVETAYEGQPRTCPNSIQRRKCPMWISKRKRSTQGAPCLSDFVTSRTIGSGKYGKVLLARHKRTNWACVLKVISKAQVKMDEMQSSIIREVKLLSYLKHPNIVKCYGAFSDPDNIYLIQEYCPDGDLNSLMKTEIEPRDKDKIIADVFEAITYMHSEGVLHRDIKPENIVSVCGVRKVCDLGWAVYSRGEARLTFCGTPLYVSPEVLQGLEHDQKADVWGLGVLTYQLIYGRVPFFISEYSDMRKIMEEDAQFPLQANALQTVIASMLQKQSRLRPSMNELMSSPAIQRCLHVNRYGLSSKK